MFTVCCGALELEPKWANQEAYTSNTHETYTSALAAIHNGQNNNLNFVLRLNASFMIVYKREGSQP